MELATQMVGDVAKSLMSYITKHVKYLTSSAKHVEHMKNRMKVLENTKADVEKRMAANNTNRKEVPTGVPEWLMDVEEIKKKVENISSNGRMGCFNIKGRHQAAEKALEATESIESLIRADSEIQWTDARIPLGRIYSKPATMSAPGASPSLLTLGGDAQSRFESRNKTFKDAHELLQQDKTRVIALWGMGGVGKTTMMNQLKKVAEDKKIFKWIVKVDVGRNSDLKSIQDVVAAYTGEPLAETNESLRADVLGNRFEKMSERKENCLVILDDVWNKIELKGLGLSPLPNGIKLFLTSRNANTCRQIAANVDCVLQLVHVNLLEEEEARILFYEITGVSEQHDPHLYQIGGNILKKCGGLPLAIKLVATTLINEEEFVWSDRLCCLEKNDLGEDLHEIIKISYDYIKGKEEKTIILLCGMFPEDSYIPIEDLTRYAWGLKLLKDVSTLREARDRMKRHVSNLRNANLLIDTHSDRRGCVKMHDLVLAFVVDIVSKGEDAWIIDHRDMSKWSQFKTSKSCKQISLACKGGSKFPEDFKFPNLSVLKLMQGDESLRFPYDFYEEMKNLQVIAYNQMKHPLLPTSFQCAVNLQTLCLHDCLLTSDLSCIGNLSNLEVLCFANSRISKLPSTFNKLKKLRLLDLTDCHCLVIDDGVLGNLDSLEEIYMKAVNMDGTEDQLKELYVLSRKLHALDIEFCENKAQPQNMSFKELERFRISVGCSLGDMDSYENTLKLVINTNELHKSRLNELFEKASALLLEVDDMNNLEDIERHPSPRHSSFCKLRELVVQNCGGLMYLFTIRIAIALPELESLEISSCQIMEELIHIDSEEGHKITFPKLKKLTLYNLLKLSCLCNKASVVELPQLVDFEVCNLPYFESIYPKNQLARSSTSTMRPLLSKEIVIPKLEKMSIGNMDNLKEIWPCEQVNASTLREIKVWACNSLVNLFPCNPIPLLQHLEELEVTHCDSIEVLFNIDMNCVHEVECNINLRSIRASFLMQLLDIWRVKGVNNFETISWFQDIETIEIVFCRSFRNVITPTTSSFDMRALRYLCIDKREDTMVNKELVWSGQEEQEISVVSQEEIDELCDKILTLMHNFHHLHHLRMEHCHEMEVIFEIDDSPGGRELATTHQQPLQLFPKLESLCLINMKRMSHVWKCSNRDAAFLRVLQKHQVSSFHNLTTIFMFNCNNIKYLFSSHMAELLSNLKVVEIKKCNGIEEVVSNTHNEDGEILTSSTSNQRMFLLHHLLLERLENLKHIGGGGSKNLQVGVVPWSLCQYSTEISVIRCHALSILIPSYAARQMQKLEKLTISRCSFLKVVFETQGMNNNNSEDVGNIDDGNGGTSLPLPLSRPENINYVPQLSSLREIVVSNCDAEYVFTFSTIKSLRQLECLRIGWCQSMKEIVKQENGEQPVAFDVVELPRLKSVELTMLPNLLGFFLGKNEFQWKSLETVEISECPRIEKFTSGHSTTKILKFMITKDSNMYSLDDCGLNFHHQSPSVWSYHNLVIKRLLEDNDVIKVIPSIELLQLKRLESIQVICCNQVEEIFEIALEAGENTRAIEIPNLRQVELCELRSLKYIWKNNNNQLQGMRRVLEFPNLTRLEIGRCNSLKHVFTTSMLGSVLQLQDLQIFDSENIEVIVKEEEECDGGVNQIELPHLKYLKLEYLESLRGFCLGEEAFSFPSLDTLKLERCRKLRVFTTGHTTAPKLKEIDGGYRMCDLREDLNSFVNTKLQEGFIF